MRTKKKIGIILTIVLLLSVIISILIPFKSSCRCCIFDRIQNAKNTAELSSAAFYCANEGFEIEDSYDLTGAISDWLQDSPYKNMCNFDDVKIPAPGSKNYTDKFGLYLMITFLSSKSEENILRNFKPGKWDPKSIDWRYLSDIFYDMFYSYDLNKADNSKLIRTTFRLLLRYAPESLEFESVDLFDYDLEEHFKKSNYFTEDNPANYKLFEKLYLTIFKESQNPDSNTLELDDVRSIFDRAPASWQKKLKASLPEKYHFSKQ